MFYVHLFSPEEIAANKLQVWDKILGFFQKPAPNHKKSKVLNETLGGYINKVVSYWLMKEPQVFLKYIGASNRRSKLVESLFNHLYLSECVTDLLVRICTVPDLKDGIDISDYNEMRNDIIQHCINGFEVCEGDEYTSSLLFDILTQITKKCYVMVDPQTLFNELMSPFLFMPLLETTFLGGGHTERGADFLSVMFWNLFIAEPNEAIIDVTERNFGF